MDKPKFVFRHLGINTTTANDAQLVIDQLTGIFGLPETKRPHSSIVGDLEVMKEGGPGEKGHIGFTVESIPAALEYLSEFGWRAIENGAVHNPDGSMKIVYLDKQVAGFAIHLFQEKK